MTESASNDSDENIVWVSHPLRQSAKKSTLAILAILGIAVLCGLFMESVGFGILGGVVMFMSLTKFFFPTKYTMNSKGITVKTLTANITREWSRYRSVYPDRNGALLSPFIGPSRLESFRGLYITFADDRENKLKYIKSHLQSTPALDRLSKGLAEEN